MAFFADRAELHLGILQKHLEDLKGQMRVCLGRISMAKDPMTKTEEVIDLETEELKFKNLDQKFGEVKDEIEKYENKVLLLTELD